MDKGQIEIHQLKFVDNLFIDYTFKDNNNSQYSTANFNTSQAQSVLLSISQNTENKNDPNNSISLLSVIQNTSLSQQSSYSQNNYILNQNKSDFINRENNLSNSTNNLIQNNNTTLNILENQILNTTLF